MDNLDDLENNAKMADSAYSNSCSNSQSRRSHSSKSTHSGSSGSSGYGGKPSTSGSSNNKLEQAAKKDKELKQKKQADVKDVEHIAVVECKPPEPILHSDEPVVAILDVIEKKTTASELPEIENENLEVSSPELPIGNHEMQIAAMQIPTSSVETSCQVADIDSAGFSCAISMHDGVVMYTTQNVCTNLGFPKDMWIGRSFIDFVHPKDRNTFASQITNGLATPMNVYDTQEKVQPARVSECKIVCRIRRYRSLNLGFGVKEQPISFMPFLLKFFFKDMSEDDDKIVFLIIQATPIQSSYKTPNECKTDATPFIIRHSAAGILEHIDVDSVPYLGFVPQDIHNNDALMMYHPDDLPYLKSIYETIVKEGSVSKTLPYRMITQNGYYVKLETEWSSYINPWSMKLEFVIGKHHVVEGPSIPDVFQSPPLEKPKKMTTEEKLKIEVADTNKQSILKILKEVLTKPAEKVKKQINKRCQDLAQFMESLLEKKSKEEELKLDTHDAEPDLNFEKDSVMLGGISPHHEFNDSESSVGTALSYNQLNYNDNLQRFFNSHKEYSLDKNNIILVKSPMKHSPSNSLTKSPVEFKEFSSASVRSIITNPSISPPAAQEDNHQRLTETSLAMHNNEMEKKLVKTHRETRTVVKSERPLDTRQKKKEHLARCNASYQPTEAGAVAEAMAHGLKRAAEETEDETHSKQHCPNSRKMRRHRSSNVADIPSSTSTPLINHNAWINATAPTQVNQTTPYILGMEQPIAMPGMYYYPPSSIPSAGQLLPPPPRTIPHTPVPLYPQQIYSPYMYPRMLEIQHHQAMLAQLEAINQPLVPLGLPINNYLQSIEPVTEPSKNDIRLQPRSDPSQSGQTSDENVDRTDGESNYSTFYSSSFFKTDSASAEDSSDPKKLPKDASKKNPVPSTSFYTYEQQGPKKTPRRKMDPPWMENVCMTPELVYKYQVKMRPIKDVLKTDILKLKEQPAQVNDQLKQLYLDLEMEGVAARLTLEEGMTSSSSDEDGSSEPKVKSGRRKRNYSQMNMIYEADAPLPPPQQLEEISCDEASQPKLSKSK